MPGMTSLKDGDLQHSSALAESLKGDTEPNLGLGAQPYTQNKIQARHLRV